MRPTLQQLAVALRIVGAAVSARRATYCFDGRFGFTLEAGWTLVISPDDAERFRVEAVLGDRVRATMWCLAHDDERLAELARAMKSEATRLVA
jgi:hypothetical protein